MTEFEIEEKVYDITCDIFYEKEKFLKKTISKKVTEDYEIFLLKFSDFFTQEKIQEISILKETYIEEVLYYVMQFFKIIDKENGDRITVFKRIKMLNSPKRIEKDFYAYFYIKLNF